ncbi:LytTR family DNA-binding domain-containing protein [uncultured Aquimarina sp.]|uniref:LytR/AlgR family response regulator transcription factor n=1 Tax=uncultured Aquimarina sp. TaxID=575652 RepID=UPI00261165E4|nr:LytTR family DNA-binding domain-containing protein [uncultured Aquimarina sp.]
MKVLIADDEDLARKRVFSILNKLDGLDKIIESSSGKETIDLIREQTPEIVFLDIQMTDMTGFDVIKKLKKDLFTIPLIIFVTAFDNFAVKAFEIQAVDFLLKPYKKERLIDSFNRAKLKLKSEELNGYRNKINHLLNFLDNNQVDQGRSNRYLDKIVIKIGKKYIFINVNDIKYITSSAYYAEIFTRNKEKYIYRISMSELIGRLNPDNFTRINRSTIICLKEIKAVFSEGLGDYSITINSGESFVLTKNYKSDFLRKMNIK